MLAHWHTLQVGGQYGTADVPAAAGGGAPDTGVRYDARIAPRIVVPFDGPASRRFP